MPTFGRRSKEELATCHPDVAMIMNVVIVYYDCSILEGWRPDELQQKYFDQGLSKLSAGQSKHNFKPSKAWHAMPWFKSQPHIDWNHLQSIYHLAGFIRGVAVQLLSQGSIKHTVRWGGDWDRDFDVREKQWNDLAHYELEEV